MTPKMSAYVNYYRCSRDSIDWADAWSCTCNDKCPICNAEVEPFRSDEIYAPLAHELTMQH
jgi:transcription initiation factor IIE alpha subunit